MNYRLSVALVEKMEDMASEAGFTCLDEMLHMVRKVQSLQRAADVQAESAQDTADPASENTRLREMNQSLIDERNRTRGEDRAGVEKLREATRVQCTDGNWNWDPYMHGMANGMILAMAIVDGADPDYLLPP